MRKLRKNKYEIRRGFVAPVVDMQHPDIPHAECWEIWKKRTFFSQATHVDTFATKVGALEVLDYLNGPLIKVAK